jgi:2-dehydropantoate 2-reductase
MSLDVEDLIWNKLVGNSCLCMAAVLKMTNDEFIAYPSTQKLVKLIIREAITVAQAKGIRLENPEDPTKPLLQVFGKFKASGQKPKCSMLQDIENGRKTEIDAITGSIVIEGKKHNIPTPANDVFLLLVKAMEEKIFNIKSDT